MAPETPNGIDPEFYVLLKRADEISEALDKFKNTLGSGTPQEFKTLIDRRSQIADQMTAMLPVALRY